MCIVISKCVFSSIFVARSQITRSAIRNILNTCALWVGGNGEYPACVHPLLTQGRHPWSIRIVLSTLVYVTLLIICNRCGRYSLPTFLAKRYFDKSIILVPAAQPGPLCSSHTFGNLIPSNVLLSEFVFPPGRSLEKLRASYLME